MTGPVELSRYTTKPEAVIEFYQTFNIYYSLSLSSIAKQCDDGTDADEFQYGDKSWTDNIAMAEKTPQDG